MGESSAEHTPQPPQNEVEYNVPQPLWNEQELIAAFHKLPPDIPPEYDEHYVPLLEKTFILDGEPFLVTLVYTSKETQELNKYDYYAPFSHLPLTCMPIEFEVTQTNDSTIQGSVKQPYLIQAHPAVKSMQNERIQWEGVMTTDAEGQYDSTQSGPVINGRIRMALVPADPTLLKDMQITFLKPDPPLAA